MSPAPVATEKQQDLQLQTLAKSVEALLLTAHELNRKEKTLQQRLKYAHDEVNTSPASLHFTYLPSPLPCLQMMRKKLALDQESPVCDGDG